VSELIGSADEEEAYKVEQTSQACQAREAQAIDVLDIYTYSDKNRKPEFAARVYWALLRAAESARRTARMYGTPLYYWENGRVVAKRP
jgi:hypothetical protein